MTTCSRSWRNSRSGQLQQVFLFMVAIIVIIATLYLGGRLVGLFGGAACDASDAQFVSDLRAALDAHSTFGSRGDMSVAAPCDARMLCLVDAIIIGDPVNGPSFTSDDPTIQNNVRNGVKTNIYLIREEGTVGLGYDDRIIIPDPLQPTCVDIGSSGFTLRTEGGGRTIKVLS